MYNGIIYKFLISLLIVLFILFISSGKSNAHGAGPSFLKINGKYSQTNPYYRSGALSLDVSQDISLDKYLVNNQINFEIDTSQLLFSSNNIDKIEFRWNFIRDNKNYKYGKYITYTYSKIGSYIVNIEAKIPGESFIVINTVQINILPFLTYALPKSTITIGSNN